MRPSFFIPMSSWFELTFSFWFLSKNAMDEVSGKPMTYSTLSAVGFLLGHKGNVSSYESPFLYAWQASYLDFRDGKGVRTDSHFP